MSLEPGLGDQWQSGVSSPLPPLRLGGFRFHVACLSTMSPSRATLIEASPELASPCAEWTRWWIGPILFLGLLLRLWHLGDVTCSFDEACSLRISQFSLREMFDAMSRDAHPPLFYLVLKAWGAVFGYGLLAARALAVCCGVIGIWLAWVLGHTLLKDAPHESRRSLPLFCAAIVALDPLHLSLSQEARPYSWGVCLALAAAICLMRAIRQSEQMVWWAGSALALGMLSMTHYYGMLTCAALVLWGLLEAGQLWKKQVSRHKGYQVAAGMALVLAGLHLVWLPWFSTFEFQQSRAYRQLWMPPLELKQLAGICWRAISGGHSSSAGAAFAGWALVGWGGTCTMLIVRGGRSGRLLGISGLAPLMLAIGYSVAVRNILGVRYLVFGQVFLLLGIVWLCGVWIRSRSVQSMALLVVGLWCSFWSYYVLMDRAERAALPGLAAAVHEIEQQAGGATIVVSSPFVYTMCRLYSQSPEQWRLQYSGHHRDNILSGPALRESDYAPTTRFLATRPPIIWALDEEGMYGSETRVRVPVAYEMFQETSFVDRATSRLAFRVRAYRREEETSGTGRSPAD